MKGIILAAGRGSRMSYMTDEKPKCLLKLNNKTLLQHQIDAFQGAGIENVGVVTGYKSELIDKYFNHKFHNKEWQHSQMVYSLNFAEEWLKSDSCIISYSDIFYEKSAVQSLINNPYDFAITYDPNWYKLWNKRFKEPLDDAESFKLNNNSCLIDIGEKSYDINDIQGQYMGLIKITPRSWSKISDFIQENSTNDWKKCQFTQLIKCLIQNNILDIHAIPYYGSWGEIDTISDLDLYNNK